MKARVVQALAVVNKAPPAATKAERVKLAKNSSVDDALEIVFAECLKHWTANEAVALGGLDPEGVHEMRVALRRMGAALSDFRAIIPAAQVARVKRETKWLITGIALARDWDVFLFELLAPVEAARPRDAGLAQLRMAAESEREKDYAAARQAIQSPRYSAFLTWMQRWLSDKSWRQSGNGTRKSLDEPTVKLADRLLTKRHRAVLKLGRDFKKLSPPERHQLRIALKKLRYTAEFFRSFYQKKRKKAYFHALAQLQNSLGHMNDIMVADHLLERLSAARPDQGTSDHLSSGGGVVIGWYAHGATSSQHQAEGHWREFCHCETFW